MEESVSQFSNKAQPARMLSAAFLVMATVLASCNSAATPPKAVIMAPNANTQLMVGQQIDIQGQVTGNALKAVDVYIDNAKYASMSAGGTASELSVSTGWVPTQGGAHTIQLKGLNENGEVVVSSEAIVLMVNAPTPTPAPTQPPPTLAPTVAPTQAAAATEAPQPTAAPQGPTAAVKEGDYVNVRKGPGFGYDKIGTLDKGQSAPVIGKTSDSSWWQIRFPAAADGVGWVTAQLIAVTGDAGGVPVAAAPPLPTQAPVAQAPTSPPAPAATQAPPPTAASQLPEYATRPYSQKMQFTPRDNIGDIPLGVNAEPRVTVLTWEVYGATKLELEVSAPKAPELYNEQCVPGNLTTIMGEGGYAPGQRFPIDVPKGLIRFTIPSTGYYVFTIYVTKADGSTTTIPRAVLVENCYKRQ
jgi:uncharacterized protein YraI